MGGNTHVRKSHSPAFTAARAAVEREAPPENLSVFVAARENAQGNLVALEAEQAAIPDAIAVARGNGDSLRAAQLRERADALRLAIHAAQVAVMQSIIAETKARANETKRRATIAGLKEEQARRARERALSAYSVAAAVRKSYVDADYELRLELLERERELQQLLAEP